MVDIETVIPDFTEDFITGYITAALWADGMPYRADDDDSEIEQFGGLEHLTMRPDGRERMAVDCRAFIAANETDLFLYCDERSYDPSKGSVAEYAGHDFWLTRQGHGAGFWDRGLGALGDRLANAAKSFGESSLVPFDCGDGTADV